MKICVSVLLVACVVLVQAKKGFGPGEQDWGFAQVRPGAKMFWWYYKATKVESTKAPLLIWLQGGPGASGTGMGNFKEMGPLDENLNERPNSWVEMYNVLFIDNPVGTGFSSVASSSLLTRNNSQIAKDLIKCLDLFLTQLPEHRSTPIYIMSESYGGKMTAEFGLELYQAIKSGKIKANLKGVGLGDAWISPITSVLTWTPFLYQLGFVDVRGRDVILKAVERTRKAVEEGRWSQATDEWSNTERLIIQVAHVDFYNVLKEIELNGTKKVKLRRQPVLSGMHPYSKATKSLNQIMNVKVKKALSLPEDAKWSEWSNQTVFKALSEDFMKPVTNIVERLLNETDIKVFVYSGQLDLITNIPGTVEWVEMLKWPGQKNWMSAPREPLIPTQISTQNQTISIIEGYVKKYDRFAMYWVLRAGHMVPLDNPAAMLAILEELTN